MPTAVGKLATIIDVLYDAIEALTPHYEAAKAFARRTTEDPTQFKDPGPSFREVVIVPLSTGRGSKNDQSTKLSKMAVLQIQVNYPASFISDSDTNYLGVEVYRADDGDLIEQAICGTRPLALDAVSSVDAPQWLGSALVGRAWCINVSVEYMQDRRP